MKTRMFAFILSLLMVISLIPLGAITASAATYDPQYVTDMFRMYDPNSGEHFYTGSVEERENLVAEGWNYEGIGFTFPANSGGPVYRLHDPVTGEHLYTMDEAEKSQLLNSGWNYEGVAFNSATAEEVPQYRLHNPNATRGAYHFTASTEERDYLISLGWESQGIGWYSIGGALSHIHSYTTEVVAPTTETEGYTIYTCACGDSYKDNYTDKLPAETQPEHTHSYTAASTVQPDCETDGYLEYTCECGYSYKESVPATGHNYSKVWHRPTCISKGYYTYTCNTCGDSYDDDYTESTGRHSYSAEVVPPTTESEGYTIRTCKYCGETFKDNFVDKLPAETVPEEPTEPVACNHIWFDLGGIRLCEICGEYDDSGLN